MTNPLERVTKLVIWHRDDRRTVGDDLTTAQIVKLVVESLLDDEKLVKVIGGEMHGRTLESPAEHRDRIWNALIRYWLGSEEQ